MRKETNLTVGQWCDRWFRENQGRWSGSTVGGYRNLIYRHILPRIGGIPLRRSWPKTPSPASMTACGARDSAPEASGASICSCGAVWMKQLVTSESPTIRYDFAGNHKQKRIKQLPCAWDSSSGT